jgi:hypothetical protein
VKVVAPVGPPKRWPIDDGQSTQNALCNGDLNGDGREDIALLAEGSIYILYQNTEGNLEEPQKLPVSGTVKAAQIVDVDGDHRNDLLLVNWEDRNPFRFRLQKEDHELGPETYFPLAPIRSYWADNLEENERTQVITIALNSGRAQVSEFRRGASEALSGCFHRGQLQVLPFTRTDKARRGMLWADVNADGLQDLLVSLPEGGQLSILFQQKGGTFSTARTFPTLAGVTDLAVADWDADGRPEIFMLSADERQVGVTRLEENDRLAFPTLIPVDGRPEVLAVGTLTAGGEPALAIVVNKDEKRALVMRTAKGQTTIALSADFKTKPTILSFHDADQDGLTDLVILVPYEKVKVLRQLEPNDFQEVDVVPPGGSSTEQPWLATLAATADIDADGKPELLLPQRNFLRAVVLQTDAESPTNRGGWTFKVKEQINGAASNSRLAGVAAVRNGTNTVDSLFLLDVERKALTLCERNSTAVCEVVRNIPLPVADFTGLQPIALGGTELNSVGFLGLNSAAWMPLFGSVWEMADLDGYETPIRDGRLNDVVSGDLDKDGRKDLVFLETARNYLDLVTFSSEHKLVPAERWQVFEERTFRGARNALPEPREAAVADMTGDGKNDLVVIVHDRLPCIRRSKALRTTFGTRLGFLQQLVVIPGLHAGQGRLLFEVLLAL